MINISSEIINNLKNPTGKRTANIELLDHIIALQLEAFDSCHGKDIDMSRLVELLKIRQKYTDL